MVEPITEEKNAETTLLQHLYVPNPLRIYPQINLLLSMMKHIWGGGEVGEGATLFLYHVDKILLFEENIFRYNDPTYFLKVSSLQVKGR